MACGFVLPAFFLRRQRKKAIKPGSARPPITPTTMPPIAPPEIPWELEVVEDDEVEAGAVDADADDGVDVGVADEAPGVVDVMANN